MRTDLTDITLLVDRSGSMHSIRDDAQGGINALIHEQSTQEGDALITLIQFDDEYERWSNTNKTSTAGNSRS